jgi:SAM-dependent methyltransferase
LDTWTYYAITHADHVVLNPTSPARLDELIGLLGLLEEPRVLDIGCGTGELLVRLAERHARLEGRVPAAFHGVGVDASPAFLGRARASLAARAPGADIELLEMDGAAYDARPGAFDLACCLGASWIFGGHSGTLQALAHATRPGGQVLVGEPFWQVEPAPEYLASSGMGRDDFGSHADNVATGESLGLVPLLALVSSDQEWDWYETLQWRAAAGYAERHADDPDIPALLDRVARARHEYLTGGGRPLAGRSTSSASRRSARGTDGRPPIR